MKNSMDKTRIPFPDFTVRLDVYIIMKKTIPAAYVHYKS